MKNANAKSNCYLKSKLTMMDQRQHVYPTNLTELLAVSTYQQNVGHLSLADGENGDNFDTDQHTIDRNSSSPVSTIDDGDSSRSAFGVDLTGKGTNLAGKSFTIAAILGLTNSEEEVMGISVQERLEQNQRQLQNYLYGGHDMQRINNEFCRNMMTPGLRQDSPHPKLKPTSGHIKTSRSHSLSCSSNNSGRSKRIRTIFTPEQLERLETEFERQQYMVGPERLYLAHALQLTEAQVKVWFQNRRIKWRKHHLEVTQQRLAVLQRHRPEGDEDI